MFLVDLSHTCHTQAQTGIQRVCRGLYRELSERGLARAITYDPFQGAWRGLAHWEQANLSTPRTASKRSSQWPLQARVAGRLRRVFGGGGRHALQAEGLLVPEVFSPKVAVNLRSVFSQVTGPRVALFHDAIALKFPELSPIGTVARFPGYLQELLKFDAIAAVSNDSRDSLIDYWKWLGVSRMPTVSTLALPLPHAPIAEPAAPPSSRPVVLCVGSLEGRKNHLALLTACERLWTRGIVFELHLIGLVHRTTGRSALERVHQLQAAGRPLRYEGPVSDDQLNQAYRECAFTVYPSLIEGFGLPVLESVSHGKPCICSAQGALGESAKGGGCVALPSVDATSLERAIEDLLRNPHRCEALRAEALGRQFKRWHNYVDELLAWWQEQSRTAP